MSRRRPDASSVARGSGGDRGTLTEIFTARAPGDFAAGRRLFEQYEGEVDADVCFRDFAAELERLQVLYAPPDGLLLLARRGGDIVGCIGLRRVADGVAEMKRLYVLPAGRGLGLGRELVVALIAAARETGYETMRLETLPSMAAAQALYRSLGFVPAASGSGAASPMITTMSLDLSVWEER